MANFIIREHKQKLDPKTPQENPDYKAAVEAGKRHYPKMKFENEAERRDYERAVKSNPNNVLGLPPVYPSLSLPKIAGIGDGKQTEILPCGHRWIRMIVNDRGTFYKCKEGHEYDRIEQVEQTR